MPKRGASGIKNLYKKHNNDCRNRAPLKCNCPWYGKYKRVNVNLAHWSGQYVDPRRLQHAVVVLNRLRTSVDEHFFRPDGDYDVLGGKQTLRSFIVEWKEHYAVVHDLDFASLTSMLRAIDRDFGTYTLEYLENASLQIERWLNELGRQRRWADNTWNRYYQMFNSLFVRAIKWKNGTVVRMRTNPMASIERRVGCKRRFRVRLEEGIEDRLFAACDRLDDVPPSSWTKLDWNKAEEIRRHSLRHEFCSRTAENTGDPVVAQELARHKDLRTTQGYLHARRARVLAGGCAATINLPPAKVVDAAHRSTKC